MEWDTKIQTQKILTKKKKIEQFIIDETQIKVGSEYIWLDWVAIEPHDKEILGIMISRERNMFIAERFISGLINIHGPHPVSTKDVET